MSPGTTSLIPFRVGSISLLTAMLVLAAFPGAPAPASPRAKTAVGSTVRQKLALRGLTLKKLACGPVVAQSVRCKYVAKRDTPTGSVNRCQGKARLWTVRRRWTMRTRERCKIVRLGPTPALGFEEFGSDPKMVAISAAAGATTDRVLVNWGDIEAIPGTYDWSQNDLRYARLIAAGIRPVLVLEGAPLWAAVSNGGPPASAHDADWRRFAVAAVRRYPLAKGFEIWNEPNYDWFWAPAPNPARYADLLKTAYSAVKSVNPAMPVVLGGLAPYATPGVAYSDPAAFLAEIYRQGAGSSFDAVGAHPYPERAPWVQSIMDLLSPLRKVMTANGDAMKPFWLTEVGVSTHGRASEAEQAAALTGLLDTAQASGEISVVLIHELKDQQGPWPAWTWGLGVLRADGSPKPAFCALAARAGHSCAVPG